MAAQLKLGAQAVAVAAVAALLALLVWKVVSRGGGQRLDAALAHGSKPAAPGFALPRLDALGTLALASLHGKVVVLNFWASWCIPCKAEAPRLQEAWQRFGSRGAVVVGVDAQDFSGDARHFMRRYGLTYPIVHDGPGKTLDRYDITGFPETYFVDRQGRLVGEHVQGPVSRAQLDRNIRLALGS